MPELPEVETIVRRLNQVLPGTVITQVTVITKKSFVGDVHSCIGVPIFNVSRRAKLIRIQLANGLNLLAHLKMTGQFIYVDESGFRVGGGHPTADWVSELPTKHTRVVFDLSIEAITANSRKKDFQKKATLYFNDQRIFGWIKLLSDPEVEQEFAKYGPDIHTADASFSYFSEKILKTGRNIKQVIMDNSIISGVGNIYACDGLNLSKIHPERKANSLSSAEVLQLLSALKQVIMLGIELGGATIDHYRTVDGFAGKYQEHVRVYGKLGESCKNCGGIIQKIQIGGRGTFFCPDCQV